MKNFLTGLLLTFSFLVYGQTPVFWLKYDEANGTTTTKEEITGSNLPITNQFGKPERVGGVGLGSNALRTDGFSTWISTSQTFTFTTSMSIETWIDLESYPSDAEVPYASLTPSSIINQYDGNNGFCLFINTFGVWYFTANINGTTYTCQAPSPFPLYSWSHVAAVIDGAAGAMTLYLNGAKVATIATPVNGTINKSTNPLIIGKGYTDEANGVFPVINALDGAYDNTKIFGSALSASTISSDYSTSVGTISTTGDQAIAVSSIRFQGDLQRPLYHPIPPANWTNESHGMVYYNGVYHMFYQRTPNGPFKFEMHWGHMMSKDLVNWTNLEDAFWPQVNEPGWSSTSGYDMKGCWSGDVWVQGNTANAFYTCVNQSGPYNPGIARATSSDSIFKTWTKTGPVIEDQNVTDYRDPFIFQVGSTYYMIIAANYNGSGGIDCYTSTDLNTWAHDANFCATPYSQMNTMGSQIWEMPVFASLGNGKYILEANPVGGNVSKSGPVYTRGVYWIGTFTDGQFTPDYTTPKNLDVIHGELSPTITRNSNNQIIAIGLADERWSSQDQLSAGWAQVFSLPRVWTLLPDNETLGQSPAPQLANLRVADSKDSMFNVNVAANTPYTLPVSGSNMEIIATVSNTTAATYGINLRVSPNNKEVTSIYYDAAAKNMILDKTYSTLNTGAFELSKETEPYDENAFGKPSRFHIFIDNSVVDVFINEKAAFSFRIYPSLATSTGIQLISNGAATKFDTVNVWKTNLNTTPVAVTGVNLNDTALTLGVGSSNTLLATVIPSNASNTNLTWSSSNNSVATVSNGQVTAIASGTTIITVKTADGGFTSSCMVTCQVIPVTGVTLNNTQVALAVRDSIALICTVAPSNATNQSINWSSSNTVVASVNSTGVVKAVGLGSATITAITADGNKTAICTISVAPYLIYDFETNHDLTGWTTTGTAFTNAGVCTDSAGWWGAFNQQGKYHFWGFKAGGDAPTGQMSTSTFTLGGNGIITFLLGGGNDINNLYIAVVRAADNTILMKTTANNNEAYSAMQFNASAYIGQNLYVELVDNSSAGFGHLNLDNLRIPIANEGSIAVTGVTLNKTSSTIVAGARDTLVATTAPSNAANKAVTWSSSNTAIATVSSGGVVTGVEAGTATITVTTQDGAKTATCAVTITSTTVPVTGVTLAPTTLSLAAGATSTLTATVVPSGATNQNVAWSSSNTSIATVNSGGVVTGVAAGTATITVTTQDGAKTATCAVTITSTTVPVTGVTLAPTTLSLAAGATSTLTATVVPSGATNQNVAWSSSNTSIATVNSGGVITGVTAGTDTITVTTQDGAKTATCAVTVTATGQYLVYDFETNHDLTGWTTSGTAFTNAGVCTDSSGWWGAFNQQGKYHFWGFKAGGDAPTGQMSTSTFTLGGNGIITFLLGGGNDINNLYIAVVRAADNTILMKTTANNNEAYSAMQFNASAYIGQNLYIELVDNSSAGFGHLNLDNLRIPTGTPISVTGVTLNTTSTTIATGSTYTLIASVLPSNATNNAVTWSSSNTSIATVNSGGVITGVTAGTDTITVTTQDGAKTATCAVTVTVPQYLVYDFETNHDLTGWTTSGTAFTNAGVCTDSSGWWGAFNQQGKYHFWGFKAGGDAPTGQMSTSTFTLGGNGIITFLLGGGNDINNLYIAVVRAADNTILMKTTANNN